MAEKITKESRPDAEPSAGADCTDAAATAPWPEAPAGQRTVMIVDAAMALLNDEGLEAVTMRRVAQKLGVGTMTLYTYVQGQRGLHRAIVARGFNMLNENCQANSTLDTPLGWRGGAKAYLHFAVRHPNLYRLMFDHPVEKEDVEILEGGFDNLLQRVTDQLQKQGMNCLDELPREARIRAGRFWIALHGLAMLAISGRLDVLEGDLDELLDDLLKHIAPTGTKGSAE